MSETSFSTSPPPPTTPPPPLQPLHTLLLLPLITIEFCEDGDGGDSIRRAILLVYGLSTSRLCVSCLFLFCKFLPTQDLKLPLFHLQPHNIYTMKPSKLKVLFCISRYLTSSICFPITTCWILTLLQKHFLLFYISLFLSPHPIPQGSTPSFSLHPIYNTIPQTLNPTYITPIYSSLPKFTYHESLTSACCITCGGAQVIIYNAIPPNSPSAYSVLLATLSFTRVTQATFAWLRFLCLFHTTKPIDKTKSFS
jgi:hypothetical protein